jgi:hypothetical protein
MRRLALRAVLAVIAIPTAANAAAANVVKELPIYEVSRCFATPPTGGPTRLAANALYTVPTGWTGHVVPGIPRKGDRCGSPWLLVKKRGTHDFCKALSVFPGAWRESRLHTLSSFLNPGHGSIGDRGPLTNPLLNPSGNPLKTLPGRWVFARRSKRVAANVQGAYKDPDRHEFYETFEAFSAPRCSHRTRVASLRAAKQIVKSFQVRLTLP